MNEKNEESRTGLNNTVVIAKCMNANCGWEARTSEEVNFDDVGNIFCPVCGMPMHEGMN